MRAFDRAGKPIASLCHGPWVLASAGLLQGRTLTSWPGVRDDLVNAGATWLDQEFVRDGNLATSRGPQDLIPFVQGCLDLFAQDAPMSRKGQQPVSRSAPQANEPPEIVVGRDEMAPKAVLANGGRAGRDRRGVHGDQGTPRKRRSRSSAGVWRSQ